MPATTYSGNALLNHLLRGVTMATPARVWISLHTADPGNAGGSEVTIGAWPAYARIDPANGGAVASGFSAAASKATANASTLALGTVDGVGALTISHFAIWDALTGGNCLFTGYLKGPDGNPITRTLMPTDELKAYAGELDIEVT